MSRRRTPGAVGDQLEAEIQAECVGLLGQAGYTVWQMQLGSEGNGAVYCTKGIPDLYIFRPGVAAWVELKKPKTGRVRPDQAERHAELNRAGVPLYVCYSPEETLARMVALRAENRRSHNG